MPSWITFCLILASLASCAQQPPKSVTARPAPREEPIAAISRTVPVDNLLRFIQTFNTWPADVQKKEVANINSQPRTEYNRMQLALITGLSGSRFRDPARAQALLDEHLKAPDSKDEGLRSLALMLKKQLAEQQKFFTEQQKLEDTVTALTQKLKDEQKKSEALQLKLDELLAIEKAMSERRQNQSK